MKINRSIFAIISLILSHHATCEVTFEGKAMEDKRVIQGVTMHTLKIGEERIFDGRIEEESMPASIDILKGAILRFQDRCNNEHAERRELSDKGFKCPIHNPNLVESVKLPVKSGVSFERIEGEKERFILWRKVYNREEFHYYDMVTVVELNNKITISYAMLDDESAKIMVENPRPRNSAFKRIQGSYLLQKDDDTKSKLTMTYLTTTDHWVLNKAPAVGVIYKNVAEGLKRTLTQLQESLKHPTTTYNPQSQLEDRL